MTGNGSVAVNGPAQASYAGRTVARCTADCCRTAPARRRSLTAPLQPAGLCPDSVVEAISEKPSRGFGEPHRLPTVCWTPRPQAS